MMVGRRSCGWERMHFCRAGAQAWWGEVPKLTTALQGRRLRFSSEGLSAGSCATGSVCMCEYMHACMIVLLYQWQANETVHGDLCFACCFRGSNAEKGMNRSVCCCCICIMDA